MGWPLASAQSLKSARNLTNMQNLKKKQCGGTRGLWGSAPGPKLVAGEGPQITHNTPSQNEHMKPKKKSHEGPKNSMGWPLASAQSLKSARNLTNMQNFKKKTVWWHSRTLGLGAETQTGVRRGPPNHNSQTFTA